MGHEAVERYESLVVGKQSADLLPEAETPTGSPSARMQVKRSIRTYNKGNLVLSRKILMKGGDLYLEML